MKLLRANTVGVALSMFLAIGPVAAQDNAADAAWLIEVLQLRTGSAVADIGAGSGPLTIAIAPRVGESGRIYATELGAEALQRLRDAVETAGGGNIVVIEGDENRTNLPDECCDAVFIRNVYHHFADPASMNASLWRSLRNGGRLAIIDFAPRGPESDDPGGRASGDQHGITAATLGDELRQAGFAIVSADQRSDRAVYLVAEKP